MKPSPSSLKTALLAVGIAALGMLTGLPAAHAQTPGSIDPTFNDGTGPDGETRSLALQTDGKVIVGGIYSSIGTTPRSGIARLNTDGSVDTAFDPGTGIAGDSPNTGVYSVALQSDGKVLVGGVYDTFNGAAHSGIARLNTDGSVDTAFNAGIDAGSGVRALAVQTDGKIILGGDFAMVDGVAKQSFARLNTDGSLDTTFADAGLPEDSDTFQIAVQADGKIVYCGNFGTDTSPLQRVNPDGSDDTGFDPAQGNGEVESLAIQADGKIVIGGSFEYLQGTNDTTESFRQGIARLLTDGSIDQSFAGNVGLAFQDFFDTQAIAIQADGKILFGSNTSEFDGPQGYGRLNTDGTLDTTYVSPGATAAGSVYSIVIQPDNNAVLGSPVRVIGGPLSVITPPPVSTLPTVTIAAKSTKLAENGPKDKLIVTRTGDTSGDLTVAYAAKGSAQAGVNYKKLSGSVVIPAGSASVAIKLKPIDDGVADGTFVLKVVIQPGASYTVGTPGNLKIKILNVD